jgi:hypothetical protein
MGGNFRIEYENVPWLVKASEFSLIATHLLRLSTDYTFGGNGSEAIGNLIVCLKHLQQPN